MLTPATPKILAVSAFAAFLSLSATSVSAINLIPNVTASTNMGSANGTDIQNTVNGAGLPGDTPALTGLHAPGSAGVVWVSQGNPAPIITGNIDFNLGGSYNLSGFSFWNFNGTNTLGIQDVSILTSTNGSTYTSLVSAPTQFGIGATVDSENPEIFTFSPTTASYVRFTVNSNYGNINGTAFSEVQFDGTAATPVPFDFDPSLGVVSLGVVFGLNKWRKNKNKDLKK